VYPEKLILITLLVKLGVAAAVSSALARSSVFKELLFAPRRSFAQMIGLLAFICGPLTLGVLVRVTVPNFLAADIAFETVILLGMLLGMTPAILGAVVMSLPALAHHEYLTLPFNVGVALIIGTYRGFVNEEDIWSFSPFIDLSIYRWVRRAMRTPSIDRQIFLLFLIILLQGIRSWLAGHYPTLIFGLYSTRWIIILAICATTAMVVGIPLKIWNALRIEQKLEEQQQFLLRARMDALQRQINPHFLFNTLNSIASLVRFRPELAREMIVKLANILRLLLKDHTAFVPLRDELAFTDDYLAIEVVRFGEKLHVAKEIDPETLDLVVPSMVLQPLIENAIKHGLEPRISGGTVTLRSAMHDGRLRIEIEDDGIGMHADNPPQSTNGTGIGIRNVRERLEVLYGDAAGFDIVSRPGRGTRITLDLPLAEIDGASAYAPPDSTRS
jgi:two-component system, LytTR family, sensor kinase